MALNVLITIDTEIMYHLLVCTDINKSIDVSIYGRSSNSQYGLHYIIEMLNNYGIKASFFVEPLFSWVSGKEPLVEIIKTIQSNGHEVQLHLHPEWLGKIKNSNLASRGKFIKDYSVEEQSTLIRLGLARLNECGAKPISCFRAGHYGASLDTLRALKNSGILFDTSYNTCYLHDCCEMNIGEDLLQPRIINGIWEIPINYFIDWPGHVRHTQITACSFSELRNALNWALENNWFCLVIVFHSFELLNRSRELKGHVSPDNWMLKRFQSLCSFLEANKNKFNTIGFSDIDHKSMPSLNNIKPIRSHIFRTGLRFAEQLIRRMQV